MSKLTDKMTFTEVGISIEGKEFFIVFMHPSFLQMYHTDSNCVRSKVGFRDWLLADFTSALAIFLHSRKPISLVSIRPLNPKLVAGAEAYPANSLPQSWCTPFVNLFASYFVNSLTNA